MTTPPESPPADPEPTPLTEEEKEDTIPKLPPVDTEEAPFTEEEKESPPRTKHELPHSISMVPKSHAFQSIFTLGSRGIGKGELIQNEEGGKKYTTWKITNNFGFSFEGWKNPTEEISIERAVERTYAFLNDKDIPIIEAQGEEYLDVRFAQFRERFGYSKSQTAREDLLKGIEFLQEQHFYFVEFEGKLPDGRKKFGVYRVPILEPDIGMQVVASLNADGEIDYREVEYTTGKYGSIRVRFHPAYKKIVRGQRRPFPNWVTDKSRTLFAKLLWNADSNLGKPFEKKIKVENALDSTNLPRDIDITNRHFRARVWTPFESMLDEFKQIGVLEEWHYDRKVTTYAEFLEAYLCYEIAEPFRLKPKPLLPPATEAKPLRRPRKRKKPNKSQ